MSRQDLKLIIIFLVACIFWSIFGSALLSKEAPTYARDGDTIVVKGQPWRLQGVNAPEAGTPRGELATATMRHLIASFAGNIICEQTGGKSYDRLVGRCYGMSYRDLTDLGGVMIFSGTAGRCARYDQEQLYVTAQAVGGYDGPVPKYCEVK